MPNIATEEVKPTRLPFRAMDGRRTVSRKLEPQARVNGGAAVPPAWGLRHASRFAAGRTVSRAAPLEGALLTYMYKLNYSLTIGNYGSIAELTRTSTLMSFILKQLTKNEDR
jgi:hypothetical protein